MRDLAVLADAINALQLQCRVVLRIISQEMEAQQQGEAPPRGGPGAGRDLPPMFGRGKHGESRSKSDGDPVENLRRQMSATEPESEG